MNERSLEKYLQQLQSNRPSLLSYYDDFAFLVDEDRVSMLAMLVVGLQSLLFGTLCVALSLSLSLSLSLALSLSLSLSRSLSHALMLSKTQKTKKIHTFSRIACIAVVLS